MVDFNFGEILKNEISKAGITQVELAKRISISQQGLTNILNSVHVNSSRIFQISEALGVNLFEKISASFHDQVNLGSNHVNEPIEEYKIRSNARKVSVIIEIDESQQHQIAKLIGI